MTQHAAQGDGTYFDPSSKQTFNFDHLRKVTSDIAAGDGADGPEEFRLAFEEAAKKYAKDHYPAGITAVYGKGSHVIVCIEDHKFQPHNFWNGRWRSEWNFNTSTGEAEGLLKVQVHYYEDGNVQLQCDKTVPVKVALSDEAGTAKKFFSAVSVAENEYVRRRYPCRWRLPLCLQRGPCLVLTRGCLFPWRRYQTAISENYGEMSDTTFKALRRALPVTRSKVDWTKITNYKVGKELSNK